MLAIKFTSKFKKDLKKAKKQGRDLSKLRNALDLLVSQKSLPEGMHDHLLVGNSNSKTGTLSSPRRTLPPSGTDAPKFRQAKKERARRPLY